MLEESPLELPLIGQSFAVPLRARAIASDIPARGRVLAFLGAKGGVGTTTVAVNVGAALSRHARVIVCELQQGGGFQGFLSKPPQLTVSALRRLNFHPEAVSAGLTEISTNLRLLAATARAGEYLDLEGGEVRSLLRVLTRMADFVILDLPAQASAATRAALAGCDRVSLVLDREPASVRAAAGVIEMLRALGLHISSVGAVAVNRGAAASEPLSEVRARIGCGLIGVVPAAATSCYLSQRLGRPFVVLQPREVASIAIASLADKLRAAELLPIAI